MGRACRVVEEDKCREGKMPASALEMLESRRDNGVNARTDAVSSWPQAYDIVMIASLRQGQTQPNVSASALDANHWRPQRQIQPRQIQSRHC